MEEETKQNIVKSKFLRELFQEDAENEIIQNLLNSGSFDQAEKMLKERIKKDPDNKSANTLLSVLYIQNFQIKSFLRQTSKLLKIDPKNVHAYYLLAFLFKLIDWEKSEYYYKKALEIEPNNEHVLAEYLDLLADMQDKGEIEKLKKVIKGSTHPDIIKTYVKLETNLEKRSKKIKKLLKQHPHDTELIVELIRCYFYTYKYKEAQELLDKEMKRKPCVAYRIMHPQISKARKWWYYPKALFTSTAKRMNTHGAGVGLFMLLFVIIGMPIGLVGEHVYAVGVFGMILFFTSLIYFVYIDRIVGVESDW